MLHRNPRRRQQVEDVAPHKELGVLHISDRATQEGVFAIVKNAIKQSNLIININMKGQTATVYDSTGKVSLGQYQLVFESYRKHVNAKRQKY